MDMTEQDEVGEGSAHNTMKKAVVTPATKPDVSEAGTNVGEHERSDSDESDYSIWNIIWIQLKRLGFSLLDANLQLVFFPMFLAFFGRWELYLPISWLTIKVFG